MVVRRGFPRPPSFHEPRMRAKPAGHFVRVMVNGDGKMYPFADRVSARDRWAIAAYIRALQLSRNAALSDAGFPPLRGGQLLSTQFNFVPVALILVALALYLRAVHRHNVVHPRHPWPLAKTLAFIGALVTTAVAIFSSVGVSARPARRKARRMTISCRIRPWRSATRVNAR